MLENIKFDYEAGVYKDIYMCSITYNDMTKRMRLEQKEVPTLHQVMNIILGDAEEYDYTRDLVTFMLDTKYDRKNRDEVAKAKKDFSNCKSASKFIHKAFSKKELELLNNELMN